MYLAQAYELLLAFGKVRLVYRTVADPRIGEDVTVVEFTYESPQRKEYKVPHSDQLRSFTPLGGLIRHEMPDVPLTFNKETVFTDQNQLKVAQEYAKQMSNTLLVFEFSLNVSMDDPLDRLSIIVSRVAMDKSSVRHVDFVRQDAASSGFLSQYLNQLLDEDRFITYVATS